MRLKFLGYALAFLFATPALAYQDLVLAPIDIVRVYDGDTFFVHVRNVPDVFGKEVGVRIAGLDTPEARSGCSTEEARLRERLLAQKAKDFLQRLLSEGRDIRLVEVDRDKYFRLLARVIVDGTDVTESMVMAGLARPYDGGTKIGWCEVVAM